MHRHPATRRVNRVHHLPQDIDREHCVTELPVGDDLCPAGPGGLRCRQLGQLRQLTTPAPAVEKLAVLSNPRPSVHCPRNIVITAKPARWVPGQTWRPDQRDSGSHMLGAGDRIGGPPISRSVQVDNILAGQRYTANSDDWHTASLPCASPPAPPGNDATRTSKSRTRRGTGLWGSHRAAAPSY